MDGSPGDKCPAALSVGCNRTEPAAFATNDKTTEPASLFHPTPAGVPSPRFLRLLKGFGGKILLGLADQVETAGDTDQVFLSHGPVGDCQALFQSVGNLGHFAVLL